MAFLLIVENSFFEEDIYETEKFLTLGLALKMAFDIQANIHTKGLEIMVMMNHKDWETTMK